MNFEFFDTYSDTQCYNCYRRHVMSVNCESCSFTDKLPRKNMPTFCVDDRSLRIAKRNWNILTHSEYVILVILSWPVLLIVTFDH